MANSPHAFCRPSARRTDWGSPLSKRRRTAIGFDPKQMRFTVAGGDSP